MCLLYIFAAENDILNGCDQMATYENNSAWPFGNQAPLQISQGTKNTSGVSKVAHSACSVTLVKTCGMKQITKIAGVFVNDFVTLLSDCHI